MRLINFLLLLSSACFTVKRSARKHGVNINLNESLSIAYVLLKIDYRERGIVIKKRGEHSPIAVENCCFFLSFVKRKILYDLELYVTLMN